MFHALENDKPHDTTRAVHQRLPETRRHHDGVVPPLWYSTPHRIQMGRTLSAKRPPRSRGSFAGAAPPSQSGAAPKRSSGFSQSVASIRCGARRRSGLCCKTQRRGESLRRRRRSEKFCVTKGSLVPAKSAVARPPYQQPLAHAGAPNDVVSIDFKGWFRARNGERIDPLTLIDNHSRYVLCCQALDACDYEHVRAVMATVFREYGLPKRIRSDNGAPFASRAIAGLSRLSIWWVKLGIEVERIPPGTPSANGRQERFSPHVEATYGPNRRRRPGGRNSESLVDFVVNTTSSDPIKRWGNGGRRVCIMPRRGAITGSCRRSSIRSDMCAGWLGKRGEMYWRGRRIFVSEVLAGEPVGLEAIDDGIYRVWLAGLELGRFDVRENRVAPLSPRGDSGALGGPSQVPAATPAEESDKIVGKEKVFTMCPA